MPGPSGPGTLPDLGPPGAGVAQVALALPQAGAVSSPGSSSDSNTHAEHALLSGGTPPATATEDTPLAERDRWVFEADGSLSL